MSGSKFRNIPAPKPKKSLPTKIGQSNAGLQQKLAKAIDLHIKNELDLAKPLYQEILSAEPNHFDALHYLGVIHYQQGRNPEALELIERAVKLQPLHSVSLSNLGNVYQSLMRYQDAIIAYTNSIELNPQFTDAYFNLGVVYNATGMIVRALESYNHCLSLNPNQALAYNNRALTLKELGGPGGDPRTTELACLDYLRATQLNPSFAQAFFNWGVALYDNKDLNGALDKYNIALELDPSLTTALNNRGNLLQELGQFNQALECFTKAIELNPLLFEAFYNRGSLYQSQEMYELAMADYDCAIAVNSGMVEAFFNRGSVHEQLKNFSHAKVDFERAIQINPDFANAHFNLALLLLKLQQFELGWQKYEWRWQSDDFLGKYFKTTKPLWQKDLNASQILIWNEQGVGDEVFFLPWVVKFSCELSEISSQNKKIICRIDSRLIELFKRSVPKSHNNLIFVDRANCPDEGLFDAHLPMGSLPLVLDQINPVEKTTRPLGPAFESNTPTPYIFADPVRAQRIRAELVNDKEVLIGISWRSKNSKTGAVRSVPLMDLVRTLNIPNVRLVNLQYGDVQAELEQVLETDVGHVLRAPHLDVMQDLDGLASLISACDLIVSADNTTVHMSGALGKKTIVLLPYTADWRWGADGHNAIWYPSVQLLRQQSRGEWGPVLQRLTQLVL